MAPHHFAAGNYRCLPLGAFSAAVAADDGFALHRARFARPLPLAEGFAAIAAHLRKLGRPTTALAYCELRSPAPFTRDGFNAFNKDYVAHLHALGCQDGVVNPVGRSNLAPITEVPEQPVLYACTYTVPEAGARGDFFLSGKPENSPAGVFGANDVSQPGLAAKAHFVIESLRDTCAAIGGDWDGITAAQIYSVHDIRPLFADVFAEAGLGALGPSWFLAWPPVVDLHFEMDVRRIRTELVI